jgi:myosin-5
MIEGKLGILDLLDEESRLPSGADKSLVVKLYQRFGTAEHKFFDKPRFGEVEFVVKHYALDVSYQIDGFIEKNRDTVSDEQLEMLNNSSFGFLKDVVKIEPVVEENPARPGPNRAAKKPTLGSIFKGSLIKLMETLRQTNPHYIRCIKPNQSKVPFEFEAHNVLGQLIACGVLETIKISRAGYPSKQTYEEFVNRYYFLVPSNEWKTDPKVLTAKICAQTIKGENKFEMGLTKVFFRAGQLAFLEKIRSEKFTKIVVLIQKNVIRGYHQRRYKKMLESAKMIQSAWNEYLKVREYRINRNKFAAITIQKNWRTSVVRKQFTKTRKAALVLQSAYTSYVTRRDADLIARSNAANLIASAYKMFKVTQESGKKLNDIIKVQSLFRGRKARRAFRKEKAELGGKLKETNYKLDAKVFELSQALDAKKKEATEMANKNKALEEQLAQWKDRFSKVDTENKSKGDSNQGETNELRKKLHQLVETKDTLVKETEKLHGMIRKRDDQITLLQGDQAAKSEEMKSLKETLKSAPVKDDVQTEALKKEITSLREQMSRLVAGKYRTERSTERFLNNDHIQSTGNQFPPVHTSAAARMSMSFFESAAQVTARVAETLGRGETAEQKPFRVRPMEIEESEPKERPVRMLEAPELQDEVIDSLITNLRIPLPSTQTVATRKEIFFPAHLLGYLLSELLQHRMVDTLRELLGHVMKGILFLISDPSFDNEI